MKNILLCFIAFLLFPTNASAQGEILYGISPFGVIYKINPETCEFCPILDVGNAVPNFGINDLVVLPNGNILVATSAGLRLFDPPSNSPIWTNNEVYAGAILGPDGLVYLSTPGNSNGLDAGLSVFDPASNTITFIGYWPYAMLVQEFFYQNGILYANASQGPGNYVRKLVQVDLADPGNTIIVQHNPPFNQAGGTNGGFASGGYSTQIFASSVLYQYDAISNSYSLICNFPISTGGFAGLTDIPPGMPEEPCICLTFAGTVTPTVIRLCFTNSVTVPYNNNAFLESNDGLEYILFSDPSDTLGSIIVRSNSPVIAFNPATMQIGVTYYLATIAGNKVNNIVDLNDPCLDISNTAAQVIWQPRPAVSFSVANPDVCVGNCLTLNVTLTGTPVFLLSGSIKSGGNVVGSFNQNFVSNTGTLQVCVPSGVSPGSLLVEATSLVDSYCPCQ